MPIDQQTQVELLSSYAPSQWTLFDWLSSRIDDALLAEIAAADYGMNKDLHFAALRLIREQKLISVPLEWEPREVLELTRWSEPDQPYRKPLPNVPEPPSGMEGHLIRAFSCTVLLLAAGEDKQLEYVHGENGTLIQLVASALELGREAQELTRRFLCWRMLPLITTEGERPFFVLAVLFLSASLFEDGGRSTDLLTLSEWVVAEEHKAWLEADGYDAEERWLFGLTFHDLLREVWQNTAQSVLRDTTKGFSPEAASALNDIVDRLGAPAV